MIRATIKFESLLTYDMEPNAECELSVVASDREEFLRKVGKFWDTMMEIAVRR